MLNPTEAAELLCGRGELSFYHDPNKGRQGEGTVGKKMTVVGTNDDSGYFFNLSACPHGAPSVTVSTARRPDARLPASRSGRGCRPTVQNSPTHE